MMLLPPEATRYGKAVDEASAGVLAVPVPLDTLWNPWLCPPSHLPYLAWALSVDVWEDGWSLPKKRAVIADSFRLHSIKGTLEAIKRLVSLAGAEVVGVERPPMRIVSGPSMTREQREAWLSGLPQLRVWRVYEAGELGRRKAYYGGRGHKHFAERYFPVASTALYRLRRRARWVVDGVETDTRVSEFGSYYRLHIRCALPSSVVSGLPIHRRFFIPSTAGERLVTIQPSTDKPWSRPIGPSLEPATAIPEKVYVAGDIRRRVYSGAPIYRRFFARSTAAFRVFDRWAVVTGAVPTSRRTPIQFNGIGRYGFAPHTARLRVKITKQVPSFAGGTGYYAPRMKFWLPHDPRPMQAVLRACRAAKRASDKIVLQTVTRPRFFAGQPFIAGVDSFIVGRP